MTSLGLQRFLRSLIKRIEPVFSKISGRSPFCPWSSCFSLLNPQVRWSRPFINIKQVTRFEDLMLLSFDNRAFWFPIDTIPNSELWNEYLTVFWRSPSNFHYYLKSFSKINKGDIIFDCGACEGFFIAKALEEGASKVFAIEPNPLMVRCLEKTFQQEILDQRVVILPFVLGTSKKIVFFDFDKKDPFSGRVAHSGLAITQTTLDDLVVYLDLQKLDLVKMDLEGFEAQALQGGSQMISRFYPKLSITTYHSANDYHRIFCIIKDYGYTKIKPSGVTLRNSSRAFRPYLIHASK